MRRVFNFSPGPGMLPEVVLKTAQAEMLDWRHTGMSIMEFPHRGPEFQQVAKQTEVDLRALMSIPDHYQVLFLPDGATAQFAMVPLNLFSEHSMQADYVESGVWSKKAIQEAKRYGEVKVVAHLTYDNRGLAYIPPDATWRLNQDAAYLHYTPNETIDGMQIYDVPNTGSVPLVADMSSMILSMPIDVSQFGIIYASAQKNVGQAGTTIVIIREDLIKTPLPGTPTLYTYSAHASSHSMYHTPSTYSWYIMGLMLTWMKNEGGVEILYQRNQRKAAKMYACLDELKDFYTSSVHPTYRSMMNVVFHLRDEALTQRFLVEANESGLANLKGHRVKEGVRASIYNAMPEEGVSALVDFMHAFAKQHG